MTKEHALSYYQKNREKINERRREIFKSSQRVRDLATKRRIKFYKLNPEKYAEYSKKQVWKPKGSKYYYEQKEKYPEKYKAKIEYNRIYRKNKLKNNKDFYNSELKRLRIYGIARIHTLRVRGSKLTKKMIQDLYLKFDNKCFYCDSKDNLSIDHIISVKNGGDNSMENLQILCMPCNRRKSWK